MLEVTALSKAYDGFEFGPVDLSVDDEVLAVLGPSGSGKTSLVSLVAGLACPDAGTITLDGRGLLGTPPEQRRTGLVFQEGALFPHMTARENIAYAAESPDQTSALADLFEIEEILDRRPGELSGGEQQRVALARTLAARPDALLLDEPLSSLDAPIRRRLRDELHSLFEALDVPVVYITHDRRAATTLGDRIAVFRDGSVEQVGPPAEVLYRPETEFVAKFTGNENIFEAEVLERTDRTTLRVGETTLRVCADAVPGSLVTACVHPSRVRVRTADDGRAENTFGCTVRRCLNAGDSCRTVLSLDDADLELVATVPAVGVEGRAPEPGASLDVTLPPDAVHLVRP
jgi:molybdate/tungstate transport system ATP-binding protein